LFLLVHTVPPPFHSEVNKEGSGKSLTEIYSNNFASWCKKCRMEDKAAPLLAAGEIKENGVKREKKSFYPV
jgi:thiol-disulfide isomerase/thioredoxin